MRGERENDRQSLQKTIRTKQKLMQFYSEVYCAQLPTVRIGLLSSRHTAPPRMLF